MTTPTPGRPSRAWWCRRSIQTSSTKTCRRASTSSSKQIFREERNGYEYEHWNPQRGSPDGLCGPGDFRKNGPRGGADAVDGDSCGLRDVYLRGAPAILCAGHQDGEYGSRGG